MSVNPQIIERLRVLHGLIPWLSERTCGYICDPTDRCVAMVSDGHPLRAEILEMILLLRNNLESILEDLDSCGSVVRDAEENREKAGRADRLERENEKLRQRNELLTEAVTILEKNYQIARDGQNKCGHLIALLWRLIAQHPDGFSPEVLKELMGPADELLHLLRR